MMAGARSGTTVHKQRSLRIDRSHTVGRGFETSCRTPRGRTMPYVGEAQWFFTAPWDPIYVRRGDPLGLRGVHDQLAERVAPGLTNRTYDARWLTLLAWCLVQSHEAWARASGGSLHTRAAAMTRYAWLRPLELLWVARTLVLTKDGARGRQLPGRRRVRVWLEFDDRRTPRFSMSPDQYRRYRQTGVYGSYRKLLRALPGMTQGNNGWTPGPLCSELATVVDRALGAARPQFQGDESRRIRSDWQGREDEWWSKQWTDFDRRGGLLLPTNRLEAERLEEGGVLRNALFGESPRARRRRLTAGALARSTAADHTSLCAELAAALASEEDGAVLASIPHLTRLADAGIDAMNAVWNELIAREDEPRVAVSVLGRRPAVRDACTALADAARQWTATRRVWVRHIERADRLASSVSHRSVPDILDGLLQHHLSLGGGVRWFAIREGILEPNTTPLARDGSPYGFRLWSLARMAVQVGETRRIPEALGESREASEEEARES